MFDTECVITDCNIDYFVGTFDECDEWQFHNCKDLSDNEDEIYFYKGKRVYKEIRG